MKAWGNRTLPAEWLSQSSVSVRQASMACVSSPCTFHTESWNNIWGIGASYRPCVAYRSWSLSAGNRANVDTMPESGEISFHGSFCRWTIITTKRKRCKHSSLNWSSLTSLWTSTWHHFRLSLWDDPKSKEVELMYLKTWLSERPEVWLHTLSLHNSIAKVNREEKRLQLGMMTIGLYSHHNYQSDWIKWQQN